MHMLMPLIVFNISANVSSWVFTQIVAKNDSLYGTEILQNHTLGHEQELVKVPGHNQTNLWGCNLPLCGQLVHSDTRITRTNSYIGLNPYPGLTWDTSQGDFIFILKIYSTTSLNIPFYWSIDTTYCNENRNPFQLTQTKLISNLQVHIYSSVFSIVTSYCTCSWCSYLKHILYQSHTYKQESKSGLFLIWAGSLVSMPLHRSSLYAMPCMG